MLAGLQVLDLSTVGPAARATRVLAGEALLRAAGLAPAEIEKLFAEGVVA
jgi:hypothetical protein